MTHKDAISRAKQRQAYSNLLETCLCSDSEEAVARLGGLKLELSYVFKDFSKKLESFKDEIFKVPLAVFIGMWADVALHDELLGAEHLDMMSKLIKAKLLTLASLDEFAKLDPTFILEKIRCFKEWTISEREDAALLYTSFVSWLSKKTFGYVPEAKDLDRLASEKRQVPFKTYVEIISHLDLRERILAKMFYLGGNRGLEEVLSVKIEDVDFTKSCIHFSEIVSYPRHLLDDIKEYTQNRKKGYLFVGKEGERISHTTPFRAIKKVVSDLDLDPEFTFRELTKNV